MNKYTQIIIIGIASLFSLLSVSCSKNETPEPNPTKRTVLVYMLASNSLGKNGYDEADLAEMKAAAPGIPADARWLVYHAPSSAEEAACLIEITPTGEKVLASYSQGTSATAERMLNVFSDTRRLAPALSYGLVLWSHATGWFMDGIDDNNRSGDGRLKSFGNDFTKKMNITTLARVLANSGFDYVYFDACYMGAVEVAYELRNAVRYIVGSPSEVPADGMPYDKNMPLLLDGSRDALVQAATNTFNHYNTLSGSSRTCTMGVYDTSALDGLATATRAVYAACPAMYPSGRELTEYAGLQKTGLTGDLEEYVLALADDAGADASLVSAFSSALSKAVVYKASTPSLWGKYPINHCCGMSTFVFEDIEDFTYEGYNTTSWASDVVSYHPAL